MKKVCIFQYLFSIKKTGFFIFLSIGFIHLCFLDASWLSGISIFRYVQRTHIFRIHDIVKSLYIYMHFMSRIITVRSFFIVPQFLRINFNFDENSIESLFFFLFLFRAMEACESLEYLHRTRDMHIYLHARQMRSVTGKSFIGRHKYVPRTSYIFIYLYLVSITLKSMHAHFLSRSLHSRSIEPGAGVWNTPE